MPCKFLNKAPYLILSLLLSLVVVPFCLTKDLKACTIKVSTGPKGGYYDLLLKTVLSSIETKGCRLKWSESMGSEDNIKRLLSGEADMALVQGDTALRQAKHTGLKDLKLLSYGYFELVYLMSRRSLNIERFKDLKGRSIWIGERGSGSREIALDLLDIYSLSKQDTTLTDQPTLQHLREAFESRDLDIAIVVSSPDAPWLKAGTESGDFHINPLSFQDMKKLIDVVDQSSYASLRSVIKVAKRPFKIETPFYQLSIPTYLIVHPERIAGLSSDVAEAMSRAMMTMQQLDQIELIGKALDSESLGVALHQDFKPVFHPYANDDERLNQLIIFVSLIFLSLLFISKNTDRLHHFIFQHTLLFSLSLIIILCLISTFGTYLAEHTINENFSDISSSFWSILIYLFSGMEDREPYSTTGKLFSIITITTGPLVIAVFSGAVASTLIKNFLGETMPRTLKDHYLIINENPHIPSIIKELRAPLNNSDSLNSVIVILIAKDHEDKNDLESLSQNYSDVYFSYGDTSSVQALKNVHANQARSILILSPDDEELNALQTLLSLKQLLRESNTSCNITIELTKPQMIGLVQEISYDFPGGVDYLARGELNSLILSQSILNPGLTGFYRDLMSVSGNNNEAYMIEIPKAAVGLSFIDYAHKLLKQHEASPYILIGVKRAVGNNYQLVCNPTHDHPLYYFKSGDFLILLSYDPPNRDLLPLAGE